MECPLCTRKVEELDTHHWVYEYPKVRTKGTKLCRECHSYIHNNKLARDTPNWKRLAIKRIAEIYLKNNNFTGNKKELMRVLEKKYNIPKYSQTFWYNVLK